MPNLKKVTIDRDESLLYFIREAKPKDDIGCVWMTVDEEEKYRTLERKYFDMQNKLEDRYRQSMKIDNKEPETFNERD